MGLLCPLLLEHGLWVLLAPARVAPRRWSQRRKGYAEGGEGRKEVKERVGNPTPNSMIVVSPHFCSLK